VIYGLSNGSSSDDLDLSDFHGHSLVGSPFLMGFLSGAAVNKISADVLCGPLH